MFSTFSWQKGRSLGWQVTSVVVACLCLYVVNLGNDGLWFQGDSPRHAANGLFWWDLLSQSPFHPVEFALSYYARYPVIQPTAYPPLFYLLEGIAFFVFGASSYVAKFLVTSFTIVAGVYLVAWLRRWVAEEAGWGGILLVLQPAVVTWSNAVMLNIPSMALGLGAVYHTRRWLESRDRKQIYLASALLLAGVLTYFPTGVVTFVIVGWILAATGWRMLFGARVWAIGAAAAVILTPVFFIARQWSPGHLNAVISPLQSGWTLQNLLYYPQHITEVASPILLLLAAAGVLFALGRPEWRLDLKLLVLWIAICYVVFSLISFTSGRYAMLALAPLVILSVMALAGFSAWWSSMFEREAGSVFVVSLLALTVASAGLASFVRAPYVNGVKELVSFLEQAAPDGRFFYDGDYDGVFSFYVRAGDPQFQRGVILGDKLLYSLRFYEGGETDYVNSPSDVVNVLKTRCGCPWVIVEKHGASDWIASARYLRQAVSGPEFQYVKSFPIDANRPTWVDVYRFVAASDTPKHLDLHVKGRNGGSEFRAAPVTR